MIGAKNKMISKKLILLLPLRNTHFWTSKWKLECFPIYHHPEKDM